MKNIIRRFTPRIVFIVFLMFISIYNDMKMTGLMSEIIDKGVVNQDILYIRQVGIQMIFCSILAIFFAVVAGYFSSTTAMGFARDLRENIFEKVLSLHTIQFESVGAASILTRATDDVSVLERISIALLGPMVRAPIMFITAILLLYQTNRVIMRVALVSAPLIFLIFIGISRAALPSILKVRGIIDHINLLFRERLTGIRVIRAFHKEEYEEARFGETIEDMRAEALKINNYMVVGLPAFNLVFNFTTLAILWLGTYQIQAGKMEIGSLMASIQYMMQVMFAASMFSMVAATYPMAQASYRRIVELFEIEERDDSGVREIPEGPVELTFDQVSFKYPGAEKCVLEDISFTVRGGERLAIIGGTGSGKSTILKLINRFYEPTEGEIRLNGKPIQDFELSTLRQAIGYVPQKTHLFSRSVDSNINLGRKEELEEEEVWDLLSIAQADDFVRNMEKGLGQMIAQSGKNLSGGQKQRLTIARAFAKEPLVYLFDDSFSALDFKTDRKLRSEMRPLTQRAATLIVAQRVMTVTDANEILVLENGKIDARGTHEALMEHSEVYREIAESQLKDSEVIHG